MEVPSAATMYTPQSDPHIDAVVAAGRARFNEVFLVSRKDGVRDLIRHLRAPRPVYYLPDMDFGIAGAAFVPFFGVQAATLLTTGIFLTSCGSDAGTGDGGGDGPVKIGISQLMDIEALDDTREGFIKGMSENGYPEGEGVEYDYQNAQGDQATATQIAAGFASSDLDLVFAIATPAAQSESMNAGARAMAMPETHKLVTSR